MKTLEFLPLEPVYFRSGRPLIFGTGISLFPPPPSVLHGVLRGIYLGEHPEHLSEVKNGISDPTSNLKIKAIFLKRGASIIFPVPLDLYLPKNGNGKTLEKYSCVPKEYPSSYPLSHYLLAKEQAEEKAGFIEIADFERYIEGESSFSLIKVSDLLKVEEKIGIRRDFEKRTTEEEALFSQGFIRLNNGIGILVHYEGLELPGEGLAKLGADGKVSYFREVDFREVKSPSPSKLFKIYLATPAIFKKGWLPSWINEDFTMERDGIKATLIAVSTGRGEFFSGWDMKEKKPKKNSKAVPSGSIYCFKLEEGNWNDVINTFHGKVISEKRANEGFGLSFVGRVE